MQASITSVSPTERESQTYRHELSQRIKERAFKVGFEKVGIVRAESLYNEGNRLMQWLSRSHHGEMAWMAREPDVRSDPRKLFPKSRSVVVVAKNYYTPAKHSDDPATGKVSRYSAGTDTVAWS